MKNLILLTTFLLFLLINPLAAQQAASSMKYAVFLTEGEKIVETHYQYIVTRLPNRKYRLRKFYPEKMQLVRQTDYRDRSLTKPDGQHATWYDNGAKELEATFVRGNLVGPMRKYHKATGALKEEGNYVAGQLEGEWRTYFEDGTLSSVQTYVRGKAHGPFKAYETSGGLMWEGRYEEGEFSRMVSGNRPPNPNITIPIFSGCPADEADYRCSAEALVRYIWGNIRTAQLYQEQLEGEVVIATVVDADGNITVEDVIHGVSQALEEEVLRIIKTMPRFRPGKVDGEATSLPVEINFSYSAKYSSR